MGRGDVQPYKRILRYTKGGNFANLSKINRIGWLTYGKIKTDTTMLENYINNKFNINCCLYVKYRVNRNWVLDGFIIKAKTSHNSTLTPVTIDTTQKMT